uniref:histone acetyltransferase n=1 Tax=Gallus gallus TaxID=9031 RepID=A0A8V0X4X8_CHICK
MRMRNRKRAEKGRKWVEREEEALWAPSGSGALHPEAACGEMAEAAEVSEGCRLPVLRRNQDNEDEWPLAEILSVKDISGRRLFYVHYIDFNKRLDEWVTPERLDLQRVQGPRKEAKTPTKNGLPGSRPDSPERDPRKSLELALAPASGKSLPGPPGPPGPTRATGASGVGAGAAAPHPPLPSAPGQRGRAPPGPAASHGNPSPGVPNGSPSLSPSPFPTGPGHCPHHCSHHRPQRWSSSLSSSGFLSLFSMGCCPQWVPNIVPDGSWSLFPSLSPLGLCHCPQWISVPNGFASLSPMGLRHCPQWVLIFVPNGSPMVSPLSPRLYPVGHCP